ncbi:MAG: protein kinase [Pirellulaceae bacterium]|nr:protein kinase [Pirellulaceae bacterium]
MSCIPSLSRPEQSSGDGRLMQILELYLADLERGAVPDPQLVIAQHPELAEPLRAYLSSLELLHRVAGSPPEPSPAANGQSTEADSRRLGDYRLIREVGRGGMGVVYEAEQISLGRRVALKVLPMAAVLDSRQLQRFRNEAQAAAALHHPNIVPVHGIGCERGVHYFAMQFIEGLTLADVVGSLRELDPQQAWSTELPRTEPPAAAWPELASPVAEAPAAECLQQDSRGAAAANDVTARLPVWSTVRDSNPQAYFRRVAQLVIQVADALDYAHLEGVLHRDIKPSNLILDAGGKVWVTDFGLARMEANPALTLSGDLVGTLRYMSPEQLEGKRGLVDHRSDVYSLGATCYELLTLQPAFADADRQQLLRRVALDDPLPPRKICQTLPIELETIVLKAMAKNASERYATAQAMADDLRQFLDCRPIKARRPNLVQRVSKWSQRHRAVVATGVVTTILGLAASTFILLYEQHYIQSARRHAEANELLARQAVVREREHRSKAERERRRAEDNLHRAFQAVDEMLTEVATKDLADIPQVDTVRRRLLDKALGFYQELLQQKGGERELRPEVAKAHQRVGQVLRMLGRNQDARQSLETAIGQFSQLSQFDASRLQDLAQSLSDLGWLYGETGDFALARNALNEALRHQSRIAEHYPDVPRFQLHRADIMMKLATLSMNSGQPADSESQLLGALAIHQSLAEEFTEELEFQDQLADNYLNLGRLYRRTGRPAEAEAALRQALEVGQRLVKQHADQPRLRAGLALSQNNLGALLWSLERKQEAEQHWGQAIAAQERLVRDHADVPQYQDNLAASYHNLAVLHKEIRDHETSVELFQSAVTVRRRLVGSFPWFPRYRRELALGLNNLGDVYLDLDRLSEAQHAFDEAWQVQQALHREHPQIHDYAVDLAGSWVSRGHLAMQLDDYPSALDCYQEARNITGEVLRQRPHDERAQRFHQAAVAGCEELRMRHWDRLKAEKVSALFFPA